MIENTGVAPIGDKMENRVGWYDESQMAHLCDNNGIRPTSTVDERRPRGRPKQR